MIHYPHSRRHFLTAAAAATATGWMSGCKKPTVAPEESGGSSAAANIASDVALRLLIVDECIDGEMIRRGWQSIGGSDIEIETVAAAGTDGNAPQAVLDAAEKSDVILAPSTYTPDLFDARRIDRPRGDAAAALASQWLPAIDAAMVQYAAAPVAYPVGAAAPVVISATGPWNGADWASLDADMLANAERSAIPTATGFAAWSWIMRLPDLGAGGFFHREDFSAEIATADNIESLDQLVNLVANLAAPADADVGWTPTQIWTAMAAGNLQLGLAIPPANQESRADFSVTAAPRVGKRIAVDPAAWWR